MNMVTSAAGRAALTRREGVRLEAYRDSVGVWTIGIGHTSAAGPPRVWPWTAITVAQANSIFADDLQKYEKTVNDSIKRPISQNAFDACVSLCYNIGQNGFAGSSVVKMINAGDMKTAADDFLLWDRPAVLLARRQAERAQFLAA